MILHTKLHTTYAVARLVGSLPREVRVGYPPPPRPGECDPHISVLCALLTERRYEVLELVPDAPLATLPGRSCVSALDLYSGGAFFESRPHHRLS
jgi:hypothetical protein